MLTETWDWVWNGTVWSLGEIKKNGFFTNVAFVFAAIGALNVFYQVRNHWRESRERKYGKVYTQIMTFCNYLAG
jgi:hypothetical protein